MSDPIAAELPPVEDFAPREPPAGCDDPFNVRPGVRAFRSWVLTRFGGTDLGVGRECNVGAASHHHEGKAWDWGPPAGPMRPTLAATLLLTLAQNQWEAFRRFGIQYIIWDRKILKSYTLGSQQPLTWYPYSGESAHEDHVHVSFSKDGRDGRLSGEQWALLDLMNHPPERT